LVETQAALLCMTDDATKTCPAYPTSIRVAWPAEADGVGDLIGSLRVPSTSPTVIAARAVVSGADLKPLDARSVIDLGCLDAGTYQGQAFLDDDQNALPTETGSAGYRDSCARGGLPPPTVVQGSTRVSILRLSRPLTSTSKCRRWWRGLSTSASQLAHQSSILRESGRRVRARRPWRSRDLNPKRCLSAPSRSARRSFGLCMPSLRLHHLTATVAGRCLFHDVTLQLEPGWTGLVGPNGAGKSTLLSILAGHRAPDGGHVERVPSDMRIALVPQLGELDETVRQFAEAVDRPALRWRGRLRLDSLERWRTLSFGERKRWQLAAALWTEPDVLLVDEPTNHLDAQAAEQLVSVFERLETISLLVSHDRALLERLTTRTLRLRGGRLDDGGGPLSEASARWVEQEASTRAEHARLGRGVERLNDSLRRQRATLANVTRRRSAGARMKSKRDSDARSMGEDFLAERAQGASARSVRRIEAQRRKLESARAELSPLLAELVTLELPGSRCPASVVARLEPQVRGTSDGRHLFTVDAPYELARDARLAITGPNGSGKSTLLKLLRASATVPSERVVEMPQELSTVEAQRCLSHVAALPRLERGRVLQWAHALGLEPEALLRSRSPSAGEARLLQLALQLQTGPWLVLLDEPTNHLSLELIERLEVALASLSCAVVVVSHDQRLADAVASTVCTLPGRL
jgi:ATPase subunit of ABC transporter with duplicated ATPase domains